MDAKVRKRFDELLPSDAEVAEMRAHEARDPVGFGRIVAKVRRQLLASGVPPEHADTLLYCYGFLARRPPRTH